MADRLGDRRLAAANAAWTSGWVHALRGEWAAGIEAGRRAVATAPEGVSRALAVGFLGNTDVEAGNHAEALPLLEQARGDTAAARDHWERVHQLFLDLRVPRPRAAVGAAARAAGVVLGPLTV